jgi:uncharacterized protein YoaH (UPF0181 family)
MVAERLPADRLRITRVERLRAQGARSGEAAEYIADVAMELRNVAKSAQLQTLQGLLEAAYYEAYESAHPPKPNQEDLEYLKELQVAAKKAAAVTSKRQRRW